ncbi:hypothetical protein OY671_004363, partial [Metschnikowia pulcherrima]
MNEPVSDYQDEDGEDLGQGDPFLESEPAINSRITEFQELQDAIPPSGSENAEKVQYLVDRMTESATLKSMERAAQTDYPPINPDILRYIDDLEYPKALLGEVTISSEPHPMLKKLGKSSERAKKLFRYINRILQDPRCLNPEVRREASTLQTYSYHIARYVVYIADETSYDETNFIVDGILMQKCAAKIYESSDSKPRSIQMFKYALNMLHQYIGIVKTAGIADPRKRADTMKKKWQKIPYVEEVEKYHKKMKLEAYQLCLKQYKNKDRSALFQKSYTVEDIKKMTINMLEKTGTLKQKDIYDGINATLEFLLGHHLLLRCSNKINLELSDAVYSEHETSHGRVFILGFQFITGKTMNDSSLPGLSGVCRHKDVEVCLVSAFAFSLWYRFDFDDLYAPLTGENALDFMDKSRWYDAKVLFSSSSGSSSHKPISDSYANTLITMFFDSIGFKSNKKTHAGRKTNVKHADAHSVAEEQTRRAGRWRLDVLQAHYINSYAFQFIHFSSGHKPEEPYFIARDIKVPEELQKMIFPWLDKVLHLVSTRTDQKGLKEDERDGTAPLFLEMLRDFRSILIQDLALLVDIAPNSIFSTHPITKHPLFLKFKQDMKKAMEESSLFAGSQDIRDAADILAPVIGKKFETVKWALDLINQDQKRFADRQHEAIEEINEDQKRYADQQLGAIHALTDKLPYMIANASTVGVSDFLSEEFERSKNRHKEVLQIKASLSEQNEAIRASLSEQIREKNKAIEEMSSMINNLLRAMAGTQQLIEPRPFTSHVGPVSTDSSTMATTSPAPSPQNKRAISCEADEESSEPSRKIKQEIDPRFSGKEFDMENPREVSRLLIEWYISRPDKLSIEERDE